jgi:alanine dehydrogenase
VLLLSRSEVEELLDLDELIDALAGAMAVESRAAALAPFPSGSNDLLQPIAQGLISADHIHAEIGELIGGSRPSRSAPEQITLYKSVGVAVQDATAAALVLRAAGERGAGRDVEL